MGEISERINAIFRLHSLTLQGHPVLGNIYLNFCQNEDAPLGVYTSVVIGENGIGKSHLLRALEDIFCCLENLHLQKESTAPQFYFDIVYSSHRQKMEFANFRKINPVEGERKRYTNFLFKRDGHEVNAFDMVLPKRVIASSTTINDKYVAKSTEMYRYKGLRNENSPSTTGTRTMVRKTVDGLMGSLDAKYGFRQELQSLLINLGLQPRLELSYNMKYKDVFVKENITKDDIIRIFEDQDSNFHRKSRLWGTHAYKKLKENEEWKLDYIAEFLRRLYQRGFDDGKTMIKYNLLDENTTISEDKEALKALSQIDLLSYPSLKVYKRQEFYEFDKGSSGESSLLCQMVSIMSDIEPNSLVLIDEPEASAHPNWQISYIGWLKTIFERYFNCHFIISTHSHFLLTDLEPSTSDIIALEKKDGVVKDVSDGVNTFNWTVDDILYEVFHIRNTNNEALMRDLERAVQLIDENKPMSDKEKDELLKRFSNVYRGERDPLGKFIIELKNYAESESK